MSIHEIAVAVGSLRQESLNRGLAAAVIKLAPAELVFKQLDIARPESRQLLQSWIERYVSWIKKLVPSAVATNLVNLRTRRPLAVH
jgi:hypothetical protein